MSEETIDRRARAGVMELAVSVCARMLERKQMFPDDVVRVLSGVAEAMDSGRPTPAAIARLSAAFEARGRDISELPL